jgi:transposase
VRITTLLNKLLNLQGLWVTGVRFDGDEMVITARARRRKLRCPKCGTAKHGRHSSSMRRWRHLGVWGHRVWIEAETCRLRCGPCGKVVTQDVEWARHGSDFTREFEDAVALMAQKTNRSAVSRLFGVSWVTVGSIAKRVVAELLDPERLRGLRRIGVDEISFRKRHRYLTVVTDHDTRRVVWVGEGKSSEVLKSFFTEIGPEACEAIQIVTMDMSAAYKKAVEESLPYAEIAYDHFHIARLANEALNEVRRELSRSVKDTDPAAAKEIKNMRWPTLYRMDHTPEKHIDAIELLEPQEPLGRAFLLKESLLDVLGGQVPAAQRIQALQRWVDWAARCRLQPFVRLGRTIRSHSNGIRAFLEHRVSNGLAEGINNKIRLLSHRAFGFHSAAPLIATIYLCCGGIWLPELQLL